uniref:Exonuclease 1 n=1 Tax=Scleropages formosus TaxID=113540 RepID=A0A8C9TAV6_SCLFO
MGISGLLQFLREASEPISVKKYKGQTVAVDTYCWIHKGAFSCAEKLAKGEPTDQYVTYCMKFVDMLLTFGVKPVLVFDGRNLPSKEEVEKARKERRQVNLQRGKQLLREGKLSQARDCFARCVNVTPAMAHEVIKAARARGVDCLVAPYEADAQLAFLNKAGIAQAIITEDSDLLAFGCKKVILKMDKLGNGLEIDQKHLGRCRSLGDAFTEDKFRYMCILSGCDYLASLYGIGLGKACKLLKMANNPDILKVIRKMGQYLKMNVTVPDEYLEGFVRANNTFLYQLVFNPLSRKVEPLNPYPDHIDPATLSYAGHNTGDKTGFQMALGNLDIHTMKIIDDFNPDTAKLPQSRTQSWNDSRERGSSMSTSIWSRGYTPGGALPSQQTISSSPNKSSTRVKEKSIIAKAQRLLQRDVQVKRARQESGVSDEDMLQQYSFPSPKKQRCVGSQSQPQPAAQSRPRNRFATLLQKRNQDDGSGDEQGTRSRFFCSSSSNELKAPEKEQSKGEDLGDHGPPVEGRQSEAEVQKYSLPDSPEPRPACRRTGVFHWSDTCPEKPGTPSSTFSLSQLQQFQHKKENTVWDIPSSHPSSPPTSSTCQKGQDEESPSSSPPSEDSGYFSQPSQSSSGKEHSPSQVLGENDWTNLSVGLVVRSADLGKGAKIRPSAPARASGLRKKPITKTRSPSNENQPGLQATISGLWRNFGFRRYVFMQPFRKIEPMSPVRDNILAMTSEMNKDVYLISEEKSVSKNICF